MNRADKQLLQRFQSDHNRVLEEQFAQMFTECNDVRLFFINENEAFTDGRNIVVDPAMANLFTDTVALRKTEQFLHLDHQISANRWLALKMVTRALTIHEALHIIYSTFPPQAMADSRATSPIRRKVLALIANIIEDAFIEAVGCSEYDNIESYLRWHNVAHCFLTEPSQGTVQRELAPTIAMNTNEGLQRYLEWMAVKLLSPIVLQRQPPESLVWYIEETWPLFLGGSVCGHPDERFRYSQRIFDIIEPLIKADSPFDTDKLQSIVPSMKTHLSHTNTLNSFQSKGKTAHVKRRLFTDLQGNLLPQQQQERRHAETKAQLQLQFAVFNREHTQVQEKLDSIHFTIVLTGESYSSSALHKGIQLKVEKPAIDFTLQKAYERYCARFRMTISTYRNRLTQLLKANVDVREEKQWLGHGISSRHLGDVHRRYWYKKVSATDVPDLSILIMIDGSGSMAGLRRESSMLATLILHEVLRPSGIPHAVVEHRAIFSQPQVEHRILLDFQQRGMDKINLLQLQAYEGTRDGLSLLWAEKYFAAQTNTEHRLIIVLSDGAPAHTTGIDAHRYVPPLSLDDTKQVTRKLVQRGTEVIAIALEGDADFSCYDTLREIYPNVIQCNDLQRLPGQLLDVISRRLRR